MDSNSKTQPLLVGLLIISVIVCLDVELVLSLQSNAYLSERVTFYPASLIVSHNPKPLTFYENTKLLNVHIVLNFTDFGERLSISNHSCSLHDGRFFNEILNSVREFQKILRRLLSLPGFSNLVECDTYLPRYYQFMTGQPTRMSCPRAYRSSISECKTWALNACRSISSDERKWLKTNPRPKRSSWMCHAGLFGIFRAIYKSTGHRCQSNHVSHLKEALRTMSRAMAISQSMIRSVNGKVVYLFKIADHLSSKVNVLSRNLHVVDEVLSDWQKQLGDFSNKIKCKQGLTMEFFSKYAAEMNRAFAAFLRLFEIQDTLNQIFRLNSKTLIGFSDIPEFVSAQLSSRLIADDTLRSTVSALKRGLSVLASPMVDVEHDGRELNVNVLVMAPEILSSNNFCVAEHLTPLKFNLSGTCYTGPVRQTNLALITCPDSKSIVPLEALVRCFSSEVGFLCPKNVLKSLTSLQWLGFAWNPELKMSFSRNHMPASSCEHLQPFVHLGGRYYLSTTSGTISTSKGRMDISTLAVYNFPCNVSIDNYEMALSACPERLLVSLPMFTTNSVSYVKWKPDSSDQTTLQLHHQSLTIPPETKINHSIVKELDDTYQYYDSQLSATRQKVDSLIDQISETAEDSLSVYLTYAALALSVSNSVAMIIACKCVYRVLLRRITQASLSASPLQPTVSIQHTRSYEQPRVARSTRPVRKNRRARSQEDN